MTPLLISGPPPSCRIKSAPIMSEGTQRTLARVSCASATHTLACAAATISGRASERRNEVARLIGKRRSAGSSGAGLMVTARSAAALETEPKPAETSKRPSVEMGAAGAHELQIPAMLGVPATPTMLGMPATPIMPVMLGLAAVPAVPVPPSL